METLERLAKLRQIVEAAGGRVDGRKKLQKLVYLCQQAGTDLGYSFTFHMYGVFSADLAQDLIVATGWRILNEEPAAADSFLITLGSENLGQFLDAAPLNGVGVDLVRKLKGEAPATLEVLSTIKYLRDRDYEGERLETKLHELKGRLKGWFPRAFELAKQQELSQA